MSSVRSFVKFSHAGHDLRNVRKYDENDEEEWRYVRFFGLFASFCALGFLSVAICNKHWITGSGYSVSLWDNNCNVTQDLLTLEKICFDKTTPWQSAVVGLLLFALFIGLLATVLCTFGVCVSSVNAKMYYFHSAGEIYFVCLLSSTVALMTYAVGVEVERQDPLASFGAGYFLSWLANAFFGGAAAGMSLDEVVYDCRQRAIARRHQRVHTRSPFAAEKV